MDKIKTSINTMGSGMKKDADPRILEDNSITHAKNVYLEDNGTDFTSVSYEPSTVKSTDIGEYYTIGTAYRLAKDITYLMQVSETGVSRIIYVNNKQYSDLSIDTEIDCPNCSSEIQKNSVDTTKPYNDFKVLLKDDCTSSELGFNFHRDFPIKTPIIKEEKTGGVLYFTDFRNYSKRIELDNIEQYFERDVACSDNIVIDCPDFEKMRIHKQYELPKLKVSSIVSGGSLKNGTYQFLIALSDTQEALSEVTSITQPVDIFTKTPREGIKLKVEDLDLKYTHYKIYVIFNSKEDNATTIYEVGTYSTNQTEVVVVDLTMSKTISRQDLNFYNIALESSENMTTVDNSLVEYGLKFKRELNLQPIANILGSHLKWQTHVGTEDMYEDGANRSNFLGINRGEVVPYGIRFLVKGGIKTAVFPLVSRESNATDMDIIPVSNRDRKSFESGEYCDEGERKYRWQYYNTATEDALGCGGTSTIIEVEDTSQKVCQECNSATIPAGSITFTPEEYLPTLGEYINDNRNDESAFTGTQIFTYLNKKYPTNCQTGLFGQNCTTPVLLNQDTKVCSIDNERTEKVEDFRLTSYKDKEIILEYSAYKQPLEKHVFTTLSGCSSKPSDDNYFATNIPPGTYITRFDGFIDTMTKGTSTKNVFITAKTGESIMNNLVVWDDFKTKVTPHFPYAYIPSQNSRSTCSAWIRLQDKTNQLVRITKPAKDPGDKPSGTFYNQGNYTRLTFYAEGDYNFPLKTVEFKHDEEYKFILTADNRVITMNSTEQLLTSDPIVIVYERKLMRVGTWLNCTGSGGSSSLYDVHAVENSIGLFDIISEPLKTISYKLLWDGIDVGTINTYEATCKNYESLPDRCSISPNKKGSFAYWQSSQTYPDNKELYDSSGLVIDTSKIPSKYLQEVLDVTGGSVVGSNFDLRCKPIRHFKFPDNKVSPFMDTGDKAVFSSSYVYPLGVTINEELINVYLDIADDNNLISKSERASIYGYEILRGDLRVSRSILNSGLLYDLRTYEDKGRQINYPNYPYNSFSQDHLNPSATTDANFGKEGYKFTYHSPETDYNKQTVSNEMRVQGYAFGNSRGFFDEVDKHPKWVILSRKAYKMASTLATLEVVSEIAISAGMAASNAQVWVVGGLGSTGASVGIPAFAASAAILLLETSGGIVYKYGRYKLQWQQTFRDMGQQNNFASYYFSEGKYNSFKPIQEDGDTIRRITTNRFLTDGRFSITDDETRERTEVNNLSRENSLFLTLGKDNPFKYPIEYSNYDSESLTYLGMEGLMETGRSTAIDKKIASAYVQMVNYNPGQHGQITAVSWLTTGYEGNLETPRTDCLPIFGGDTFITRHTLKRKMPLFLTTAMGQASMTPFNYENYNNIGDKPRFYCNYETSTEFSNSGKAFPEVVSEYSFDNEKEKGFYKIPPTKFYLYYYGIPSYLCETRINTTKRESGVEQWEQFYPEVGDIGDWTQETNVSIKTPNFFKVSNTYSNQVNVHNTRTLPINYSRIHQDILENSPNGAIFSLRDNDENGQKDPWVKFKPLDFYEFDTKYGKLVELKPIENEAVLARFNDTSILYNKVDQTSDNGQTATNRLGGKSLFRRRTASFVNADTGFGGGKQTKSLSCEFGHFHIDTDRGQVIMTNPSGSSMTDISRVYPSGKPTYMQGWFNRNLPFKLKTSNILGIEDFPEDNNFNGIGISLGYEPKTRRILITKKDYLPLKDCLKYVKNEGFIPTDPECFTGETIPYCDKGWEYNRITNTCEKKEYTPACPTGYKYNATRWLCEQVDCKEVIREVVIATQRDATMNALLEDLSLHRYGGLKTYIDKGNFKVDVIKTNDVESKFTGENLTTLDDIKASIKKLIPWSQTDPRPISSKLTEAICMAVKKLNKETDVYREVRLVIAVNNPESGNSACDLITNVQDIKSILAKCKYDLKVTLVTSQYWNIKDYLPWPTAQGYGTNIFASLGKGAKNYDTGVSYSIYGNVWEEARPIVTNLGNSIADINLPNCQGTTPPNCSTSQVEKDQCVITQSKPPLHRPKPIDVRNKEFFKEVSWTIAFSPTIGEFNSFMSYVPDHYVVRKNGLDSLSDKALWTHNATNKSFGVFYGNKHPMEVELVTRGSIGSYLGSVSLMTESKRFNNNLDFRMDYENTFNKSTIYNRSESSGEMDLDYCKGGARFISRYPMNIEGKHKIPVVFDGSLFNYNYFYDRVVSKTAPFKINDVNQIDMKTTNTSFKSKGPLKRLSGDYLLNRLVKDDDHNNQLTLKLQKSLTNLEMSN